MATTNPYRSSGYKPNGVLNLPLGWRGGFYTLTLTGGPYAAYPDFEYERDNAFGVMVRAEGSKGLTKHIHLPIEDFSVPEDDARTLEALKRTAKAALSGRDVYVGCMGGWGRTGLFLALMAKAAGIPDPVAYVRANYSHRAVETGGQQAYVRDFDVTELTGYIRAQGWLTRVGLG